MVRNGKVSHPSEWPFGGYSEIQNPRRKNILIAYEKLRQLTGFNNYDEFHKVHKDMVEEFLSNGKNQRQAQWSESIAVGSKRFIETIKGKMGILAKGRMVKLMADFN